MGRRGGRQQGEGEGKGKVCATTDCPVLWNVVAGCWLVATPFLASNLTGEEGLPVPAAGADVLSMPPYPYADPRTYSYYYIYTYTAAPA